MKQLQFELWQECGSNCAFCVPAGTMVKMSDMTEKPIEEIVEGDVILSFDRKKNKYIPSTVLKTANRFINEPIYKINAGGSELLISKDHPIAVPRGKKWLEPKYLYTAKEQIVYVSHIPSCKEYNSDEYKIGLITRHNVDNIEPINFSGQVFNIQTECESYIANNMLVHNCYLGEGNRFTSNEIKLKSLQNTIDKISDLSIYKEYDTLSYLGGEFFQGQLRTPEIKEKFMELMEKTAWLKDNGYIKNVWIYATMTIGDQHDLYEALEKFKDKNDFWILTSYDTMGRFHTPKMLETWDYNMRHIHELYPEIKFNITSIIYQGKIFIHLLHIHIYRL